MIPSEALMTLSDTHCPNVTIEVLCYYLRKELQKGEVMKVEGHKGGRSGSEGIMGAQEGMEGPQRVWVVIKRGSNYFKTG